MNDFYYNAFDTAEEFTLDVIALVFAGYKFTAEDLENLDSISLINAEETLQIERKSLEFASNMYHAIYTDIKNNRLKINDVDKSSNLHEDQLIYLTREEIKNWFESKEIQCPETLLPRDISNTYEQADQNLKKKLMQTKPKQETITQDANSDKPQNNNQINSLLYDVLLEVFEQFPKQYPNYETTSTLIGDGSANDKNDSVTTWIINDFSLTIRQASVFAKILQEHYKYSNDI